MRQSGQTPAQILFCQILLHLRDARLTYDDWQQLMKQTPARLLNLAPFTTALHLHPTIEAVVDHNVSRLRASGQPIATIKAISTQALMPAKPHLRMQVVWSQSSVWHMELV